MNSQFYRWVNNLSIEQTFIDSKQLHFFDLKWLCIFVFSFEAKWMCILKVEISKIWWIEMLISLYFRLGQCSTHQRVGAWFTTMVFHWSHTHTHFQRENIFVTEFLMEVTELILFHYVSVFISLTKCIVCTPYKVWAIYVNTKLDYLFIEQLTQRTWLP